AIEEIKVQEILQKCERDCKDTTLLRIELFSKELKRKVSSLNSQRPSYYLQTIYPDFGEVMVLLEIVLPSTCLA
ncbi:hypothetical protein LTR37_021523, partial [Vermiconidia calcicola]